MELVLGSAIVAAAIIFWVVWRLRNVGEAAAAGIVFLITVVGVSQWRDRQLASQAGTGGADPIGLGLPPPGFMPPANRPPGGLVRPQPASQVQPSSLDWIAAHTPAEVPADGYISSESCRECHAQEHETWHASYHRTMTQPATPEAVFGDFDDVQVQFKGLAYNLEQTGQRYSVDITLPDGSKGVRDQTVVLATGSHHMQIYWLPIGVGRTLAQLPICYLKEAARWVPVEATFLMPPTTQPPSPAIARWNRECIQCHTTHGRSRPQPPVANSPPALDSQVAQFGIACEACHGPAEEHVRFRRGGQQPDDAEDPITNPARLPHNLSAQVCGRCHGISLPQTQDEFADLYANGHRFRPGQELISSVHLFRNDEATRQRLKAGVFTYDEHVEDHIDYQFWSDGMVRVSGREFNGLHESACYQRGEMSCISCHQMHQDMDDPRPREQWTDDQLQVVGRSDDACLQCHSSDQYAASDHTHHATSSAGSRCYNCHMPHTTYGLLKAIRSHTIESPSVASSLNTGRPNACNLCHLDQSLGWTATHLAEWYEIETPELSEQDRNQSAAVQWALKGDAGQRALLAWHMGWSPALKAAGDDWLPPYLAVLLDDPYDVVRYIAGRSLRQLPDFGEFSYDFVANQPERAAAARRAREIWDQRAQPESSERPRVLIGADGKLQQEVFDHLRATRDDKPVILLE